MENKQQSGAPQQSPLASLLHVEENQVLFVENLCTRKVILNRPKKLNVLSYRMIAAIHEKLKAYENDSSVKLVILKGTGKAFCAGGDVTASLIFMAQGHWSFCASFYRREYNLDYLVGTYKKPVVALLNGIVMGGGAGLSMHSAFRIVTENTLFAMPEASIGIPPDVGASYFLARLPGFIGEYIGLTGTRLDGADMVACGLATHFVYSKDLDSLEYELSMITSPGSATSEIANVINKYATPVNVKQDSAFARVDIINKCYSRKTVEEILSSLESYAGVTAEKWISSALSSMNSACPTTLKLFLRTIRLGRSQKLRQCLVREYIIFCHLIRRTVGDDFYEGTRAVLVDKNKSKPKWNPSKLELVTEQMLDKYFADVEDADYEPLTLPERLEREHPSMSIPHAMSVSESILISKI